MSGENLNGAGGEVEAKEGWKGARPQKGWECEATAAAGKRKGNEKGLRRE